MDEETRHGFGGIVVHRCREQASLLPDVHAARAEWLLAGAEMDDGEIQRAISTAGSARRQVRLAILGDRRDWRRYERWMRRGCRVYLEDTIDFRRGAEAILASERLEVNVSDAGFVRTRQECTVGIAPHLTRRERDVLDLLRCGLRNREIARALHVSENTTEYHMRHLLSKFGARNRLEVVERATAFGLA